MYFLLFIPALLVFLYALYRLVKDDYIFIRKGISLEQSFDIAFITLWIGLFVSRVLYLLLHFKKGENVLADFFSFKNGGLSLTGAVVGGVLAIYLISKYKRLPLGRLSDFLSLSFLYALPFLFLANAIFVTKNDLLFVFLNAIVYFVLLLFFVQFIYPKIMNRSFKEGMLAILFLLLFSLIALTTSLLTTLKNIQGFLNLENIILLLLFLTSIFLFVKLERGNSRTGRTMLRS
jgi:prolipoprotein diacylglyceryltransferase